MKSILRSRSTLLTAASITGALLAAASPALAQSGVDILTLRGPGSSIGVEITELDADKAKASAVENGVVIANVQPDTPAARAGFQSGDIVVEFDGEAVRSARQFRRLVEETRPGHEVKATVVRDRSRRAVSVTPELAAAARTPKVLRLPALRQLQPNAKSGVPFRIEPIAPFNAQQRLGLSVMPLQPQLAEYFGAKQGLLVTGVTADAPASRAGIKAGDVILEVGARPVENASDVTEGLRTAEAGGTVDIKLLRDKKELVLKVAVPAAGSRFQQGQTF
jgi:serine protease Do